MSSVTGPPQPDAQGSINQVDAAPSTPAPTTSTPASPAQASSLRGREIKWERTEGDWLKTIRGKVTTEDGVTHHFTQSVFQRLYGGFDRAYTASGWERSGDVFGDTYRWEKEAGKTYLVVQKWYQWGDSRERREVGLTQQSEKADEELQLDLFVEEFLKNPMKYMSPKQFLQYSESQKVDGTSHYPLPRPALKQLLLDLAKTKKRELFEPFLLQNSSKHVLEMAHLLKEAIEEARKESKATKAELDEAKDLLLELYINANELSEQDNQCELSKEDKEFVVEQALIKYRSSQTDSGSDRYLKAALRADPLQIGFVKQLYPTAGLKAVQDLANEYKRFLDRRYPDWSVDMPRVDDHLSAILTKYINFKLNA